MVLAVSLFAAIATPTLQCALTEQASAHQSSDLAGAAQATAHQHDHHHHDSPTSDSSGDTDSCCSGSAAAALAPFPQVRADELTSPRVNAVYQPGHWSTVATSTTRRLVAESLRFQPHSPPIDSEKLFLVNSLLLI